MNNFNTPYFAVNIKDFWDRWHISLTSWFRDYLYFPLGGSKKGKFRKYLNILIVFAIPFALAILTKVLLETNEIFSPTTVNLLMTLVFCVFGAPIITFKQLHYVFSYKSYSKPLKEDFNNELKNVMRPSHADYVA